MRKIRVICSDPYATDCSTDDEESIEANEFTNGKQFVHEITVSIPTLHLDSLANLRSGTFSAQNGLEKILMAHNCHSDTSDSSREAGPAKDGPDGTVSEKNNKLERAKHPGLRVTSSGKWGVQLYHPIQGTKMWFGSYNTIEEATVVCKKKRIEFAMLSYFNKKNSLDELRPNHRRKKIVVDDMTVLETASGKWAAWTTDKVSNVKLWLGVYTTPEEAMAAYRKKLEFDSNCTLENPRDAVVNNAYFVHKEKSTRGTSTEVVDSQGLRVMYKGIRLRQSGRWAAEISDPTKRKKIHLGTYDTPEEAADVYNKKRLQFEKRIARGKKRKLKHVAEADDVGAMIKTEPNNVSQSLTLEAENSTVTAVGSQDSEGSNTNNDNQTPGSSLAAEDEFGFGVINRYGQFIGEYSTIDDELLII